VRLVVLSLLAWGCTPDPVALTTPDATQSDSGGETGGGGDAGGSDDDEEPEQVGESAGAHPVFDKTVVHELHIDIDELGIQALRDAPTEWTDADLRVGDRTWEAIGIRIKGSASWQPVDEKPALKLKFDEYRPGQDFYGLQRLTLNNEVYDPTMMAETLSYQTFRRLGSPAPRTGYAAVWLADRYVGLYAVIESMDDDFMDHTWPDSNGGMWEMTRECDFTGDCTCFDLQETGGSYEPEGIDQGCAAVASEDFDAIQRAFDWDAVEAFLATETALNHPDSYTWNLNNFFVYHDPIEDELSLIPWGADSTFVYATPASTSNPDCDPLYTDVLEASPRGWLMGFCRSDSDCAEGLEARILAAADLIEEDDLVGQMAELRDQLDPWAERETWVNWTLDDREAWIDCFQRWTEQRPDELRAWVDG